ncbi:hypothetical protein VB738_09465 [Cyanobium gracile UHCC 0139]|uniref:Uncharacterized protein n=1 Tax=Cyanobium gracile UHCC 0139 TaxID=3110308 RepID=A0ABU5RUP9_9CYAN|nr:hypothetical protein [Cyanobium gracile]MEA5391486.1 hypothetical protein [Cyanobium gracile UHCC 0139]
MGLTWVPSVQVLPLARLTTILFALLGPFDLAVNIDVLIGRSIQLEQREP